MTVDDTVDDIVICNVCEDGIRPGEEHECSSVYTQPESEPSAPVDKQGFFLLALQEEDKDQLDRIESLINKIWQQLWPRKTWEELRKEAEEGIHCV